VFHDPRYRLPFSGIEAPSGVDVRRPDDALTFLLECGAADQSLIRIPRQVSWADLQRVHTPQYLESLSDPTVLAHIFAVDPSDVVVDTLLATVRLACGGTLDAARYALETKAPALNLLGGFHHAAPSRGVGFCAVNDIAVAVEVLRSEGFDGQVCVIDLDAHPSDGTAECLGGKPNVWLGSIAGVSWGELKGVDEVNLPQGTGDGPYLEALAGLLSRMPKPALAFVLAGADVLAGDRLGTLGLSIPGAQRRDLTVFNALHGAPSVWLPAGGYSPHAWKVLAGTGMVLAFHDTEAIPPDFDPLASRFRHTFQGLKAEDLGNDAIFTEDDLAEALGQARPRARRFVDFYTAQGLEFGLEQYGLLPILRRMGFDQLHIELSQSASDRARLMGVDQKSGEKACLIELDCEKRHIGEGDFLFVNWLSLRNPRAQFSPVRPKLPGQEVPGLGLAREMSEILGLMARRLSLQGVAFQPSWFHMAYAARHTGRFVDPERQGRFDALLRDLKALPLLEATRKVAEGQVKLNGAPYRWEPDPMVQWLHHEDAPEWKERVAKERERCRFEVAPRSP
jgi:acetoin utilization deacetylase AcuC-like enzyme